MDPTTPRRIAALPAVLVLSAMMLGSACDEEGSPGPAGGTPSIGEATSGQPNQERIEPDSQSDPYAGHDAEAVGAEATDSATVPDAAAEDAALGEPEEADPAEGMRGEPEAQPEPVQPEPPAASGGRVAGPGTDLPAPLALARRAEATLNAAKVVPTLVVVPDVWSYAEAIARWTPELRYPVLIDDGSAQAAANIGRFVRGFEPEAVVSWKAEGVEAPRGASLTAVRVNTAIGRAWGVEEELPEISRLVGRWMELGHRPPGIIVANPADEAWAGALALGAARGEPILWTTLGRNVNAFLSLEEAKALSAQIEAFCDSHALSWARLGDAIDAVTVCANAPVKLLFAQRPDSGPEGRQYIALTDFLGRHLPARAVEGRWGWAGQIHGDASEAAYRAMCGLFIRPKSAWVFDSYTEGGVWQAHDGSAAKATLERAGWSVRLDDAPNATDAQWRGVAAEIIDPGVIMVTTMGNSDFFDLGKGNRCAPGDLPMLDRPAMLHFVHSWSLLAPTKADTIGARWFDRGVYAYAGSIQEPFLSAFVPTPLVAERLASGEPWGVVPRVEGAAPWRVAVFGDPLITSGPTSAITRDAGAKLPLAGVNDLAEGLKDAIGERDFASSLRLMTLLARDEDAERLLAAIVASPDASLSPEAAAYAITPAFRSGDLELLIRVQQSMAGEDAKSPRALDPLWNLTRQRLNGLEKDSRDRALDALRVAVREEQLGPDGVELARWLRSYRGRADAEAFAATIEPRLRLARDKNDLRRAVNGR